MAGTLPFSYKASSSSGVVKMSHVERFKVVLLGEGRVGKTSILLRYTKGEYSDRQVHHSFATDICDPKTYFTILQVSTLQASYLDKRVTINSTTVQLSIWDTAGILRFVLHDHYYEYHFLPPQVKKDFMHSVQFTIEMQAGPFLSTT